MNWALLRFTSGPESRRQHEVRRRLLDRLAPQFRRWQRGPGTAALLAEGHHADGHHTEGCATMRFVRERSSGPGLMLNLAEALVNYCDEPGELARLAHAIWPGMNLYAEGSEWRFFTEWPGPASFCVVLAAPGGGPPGGGPADEAA